MLRSFLALGSSALCYRNKDVGLKCYRTGSCEVSLDLNLHEDHRVANLCGEQTNTGGDLKKA